MQRLFGPQDKFCGIYKVLHALGYPSILIKTNNASRLGLVKRKRYIRQFIRFVLIYSMTQLLDFA